MNSHRRFAAVLLVAFALAGGILTAIFAGSADFRATEAEVAAAVSTPAGGALGLHVAEYMPPEPTDAPEDARAEVIRGQRSLQVTPLPARNGLRCSNCHFRDGLTRGGRDGGFSLVGAAARRPVGLADRVLRCYRVNLNNPGPERSSPELGATLSYLWWISKGVPAHGKVPWLEPRPLATDRRPDLADGERTFRDVCAQCHGNDGQGSLIAPPLWGSRSFTSASSMARLEVLAAFVADNMPRQNPTLSSKQAFDSSAFVLSHARPAPSSD